jgi:Zn-dependent protease
MEYATHGSIRLFRFRGIDVWLHWMWFLIAYLWITMANGRYQANYWNVIEYVALFFIVLLHEFGHALACRSVGGHADTIVLWPLGGIAYVAPPARPGAFLWSIFAGPLVNLVLVPVTWGAVGLARINDLGETNPDLLQFLYSTAIGNTVLLIFNLVPIYPLDGGQILQALLWCGLGRWRSLEVVGFVGLFCGGLMFLFSLTLLMLPAIAFAGLPFAFISIFICMRSWIAIVQARHMLQLLALPRHDNCACPNCRTAPPKGDFWVCDHCNTRFDLFACKGQCHACGAWFMEPDCPFCHHKDRILRWFDPNAPTTHDGATALDETHQR